MDMGWVEEVVVVRIGESFVFYGFLEVLEKFSLFWFIYFVGGDGFINLDVFLEVMG